MLSPSSSNTMQMCPRCSNQSSILTQALSRWDDGFRRHRKPEEPAGATHNLWSSSRLLISSSTAISDLAASRKRSMFRTTFTATRSPLWNTAELRDNESSRRLPCAAPGASFEVLVSIEALHHFSKRSRSQSAHHLVCGGQTQKAGLNPS